MEETQASRSITKTLISLFSWKSGGHKHGKRDSESLPVSNDASKMDVTPIGLTESTGATGTLRKPPLATSPPPILLVESPPESPQPVSNESLQWRDIDSLPFEIHQEILLYFRPPAKTTRHPINHLRPYMSVCKQWRDVIVQTRLFWTTLHIKYHPLSRWYRLKNFSEFIPHLEVLFERSNDAPLDVFINISGVVAKECTELLHFFQRSAKLTQWRTLEVREFRSLQTVDPELMQEIPFQRFSGLQHLSLGEVRSFPFLDWLDTTATQLSSLSVVVQWSDVRLPTLRDTFPRILDRINELELKEKHNDDMEGHSLELPPNILKLSTNLLPLTGIDTSFITQLSVTRVYTDPNALNQSSFPRLQRFDVEEVFPRGNHILWLSSLKDFETSNFWLRGLMQLDFPSLDTFRIREATRPPRTKDTTTIIELFKQFNLTPSIVIFDIPISPEDIRKTLTHIIRLKELRIQLDPSLCNGQCLCHIFLPKGHQDLGGKTGNPTTLYSVEKFPPLQHLVVSFKWDQTDTKSQKRCATNVLERYEAGTLQSIQLIWEDGNQLLIRSFQT
jgi:hypothetical protein